MKHRHQVVVLAGFLLLGSICTTPESREWERGFFVPIQTEPYKMPGDLNVSRIVGYDDEIESSPWPLQMNVRNDGDQRVTDVMPAGLVFSPSGIDYAYMILLQEFTITVPALRDTVILLPTYSCNEGLDEPDDESNYFVDNRAWDVELKEMYDLLEGKILLDSVVSVDEIQDALWEITDGEGLTDSTRTWLKGLK